MDLYSTFSLNRVVEELPPNPSFLLNMFFPFTETSNEETIYFDHVTGRRRMTPFVAYDVQGQVVQEIGYETFSFKPAYVKDKRVFDPNGNFKRLAGEKIGGSLNPEERLAVRINRALADQMAMWTRRQEAMAAEVLRTGKLVISGERYPTKTVDFQRDSSLTVALTGANKWSAAGVDPLASLETWHQAVFDISYTVPTDVILATDVWKTWRGKIAEIDATTKTPTSAALMSHARLDMRLDSIDTMRQKLGALVIDATGVQLVAVTPQWRIWVYKNVVEVADPANPGSPGTLTDLMPSGTVLMGSADLEGTRHFGAIRDLKAGIQPREFFVKSFEEEDPSVRYILGQSAPLLVPYRKNAVLAATVL